MFCESTEYMVWAVNNNVKNAKNWTFNYDELKELNIKKCKNCNIELNYSYRFCPYCSKDNFEIVKRQMRNMWDVPMTPKSEKKLGNHPSQKPVSIIKRLIVGCSNKGDIIIDPFTGSGTIPAVARLYERRFIAIDNNENFCRIGRDRINSLDSKDLFS